MAYKYHDFSPPAISASTIFVRDFQALLDDQFDIASDVWDILEETVIGSGNLETVRVRITGAISTLTSEKLPDDFKQLIFSKTDHNAELGKKYFFDDNWWICVLSEGLKTLTANCVVRRANNTLRWVDENGNYYSEFCCLEYKMNRPKETPGTINLMTPEGYTDCIVQLNDKTKTISGNQRFLFGPVSNRTCLRTFSKGVVNYLNQSTEDDESAQPLMLSLGGWELNPDTDDLINGIADGLKYNYTISASPTSIIGNVGTSIQIIPSLMLSGNPSNKPLSYSTSSSYVATVSSSGLVTLISSASSTGSMCNISCYMTNNTSASVIIPVSVITLPYTITEIITTPNVGYVLEGSTTIFNTKLFINGTPQSDTFTFTTSGSPISNTNYILTSIDGNNFSIENVHRYLDSDLTITATSGSYISTIPILLKGAY